MKYRCRIRPSILRVFAIFFFFCVGSLPVVSQSNAVETSGDVLFVVIPTVAFGTTLLKKDKEGSKQFVKSFLVNFATTAGLKILIDKQRPNKENGNSFPSGHTSVTFQGASFIQRRYGWKIGLPAYLLASYTGFTRINADKHYMTDIIAGAVIGVGSTYLFTTPYQQEHMELSFSRLDNTFLFGFKFKF